MEITKISKEQAREMARDTLFFIKRLRVGDSLTIDEIDDLVEFWVNDKLIEIEQTAEERFEEFARGIQFDWATNFSIYREKLVSLARAAIREKDEIIKSLREANEGRG